MFKGFRLLVTALLALVPLVQLLAQNPAVVEFNHSFSHRELSSDNPEYLAASQTSQLYHYHDMTSTNDVSILEGNYVGRTVVNGSATEFMNYRIIFPRDYNVNRAEKYPMIVMFHGAGEGGRLWSGNFNYLPNDVRYDNNSLNTSSAGASHMAAAAKVATDPKAFPGIVVFPQASYNAAWESNWDNGNPNQNSRMVENIIYDVIATYNVDRDRIYVHGLSNGAKGTWDFAAKHPELIAAILPMSGVPSDPNNMVVPLVTTPIWLFQGGIDTNPKPQAATDAIAVWAANGGSIRFTLYPTLGHSTWTTAYAEPDFFSWMLSKSKRNIYVFGGDAKLCPSGSIKLGFSANYVNYQWYKDGSPILNETTRYYTATQTGSYVCRYTRYTNIAKTTTETVDSNPTVITTKPASTYTPVITQTASNYEQVEIGGVFNYLTFTGPAGFSNYQWYKDGSPISTPASGAANVLWVNTDFSTQYGKSTDAGLYTLTLKDAGGCTSQPSTPIQVNYNAAQPTTNAPSAAPVLQVLSTSSIKVTWLDYNNEVAYELYRYRKDGSFNGGPNYTNEGWTLINTLPANTTSFTDAGLKPSAKYQYQVRMLLADGTTRVTPQTDYNDNSGITNGDNSPPTTPTGLIATNITSTGVTLSWTASDDDDLVYQYKVYNGSAIITTLTGPDQHTTAATTVNLAGLVEGSTNVFTVQAFDLTGNASPLAEAISVTLLNSQLGLNVKYWPTFVPIGGTEGQQLIEPGGAFNFSSNPVFVGTFNSGTTTYSSFEVTQIPAIQQNTPDPTDFVMSFDGYVNITVAGSYTFQTTSTGASRLYVGPLNTPTASVSNDGLHTSGGVNFVSMTKNSSAVTLAIGKYPIRVTYYDEHAQTSPAQTTVPVPAVQYNNLIVRWKTPSSGGSFVVIPYTNLFLTGNTISTYYLKTGTTDPTLLSSWTDKSNGTTGNVPGAFTAPYTYFNIANRTTVNFAAPWTVTGAGSKIIVAQNVTVNFNAAASGTLDAGANSVINVFNSVFPTFGSLATNSTVNLNVPGNAAVSIPTATYGTLNLQTANPYTFPLGTTTIQGNLTIAANSSTTGITGNVSSVKVGGDINFSISSGNPFPATEDLRFSLVFTGGKTHNVSFTNGVDPYIFSLKTDPGDNIVFVNPGYHTYTFGSSVGGGLILQSGSTLNLGAGDLVIAGKGTVNPNSETGVIGITDGVNLTLTSTAPRSSDIIFKNGEAQIANLTTSAAINTSINLKSTTKVTNLVTVSGGLLNAGDEANLVLVSDSVNESTGRIGPIPSGARINGNIVAQRYMPNKGAKIYQYISSPVKYATAEMLQQAFPITGNFTGKNTIPGVPSSSASMFWYAEPTYNPFPANGGTNADTMKVGRGYTAYVRKTDGSTTWSVKGAPNQGTINFTPLMTAGTASPNDGWNLIGNPYPSPIQWTGSATGGWSSFSNLSNTVYVRENNASGFQWHVYRPGINAGDLTTDQSILDNGVIAPGQAFWVQASGLPSLAITENAKYEDDGQFYRTTGSASAATHDVLSITMSNGSLFDQTYIVKDDAGTENYEKSQDAVKQFNSTFNLSTLSKDKVSLVINVTPATYCEKNTRLSITSATAGTYTFAFKGIEDFNQKVSMSLKDNFLGTTTDVTPDYVHTFQITADSASTGSNRFVLTEKPLVNTALSLKGSTVCESNPKIIISSPQDGVAYAAMFNGVAVSDAVTTTGTDSIVLTLKKSLLGPGDHAITVTGSFATCTGVDLTQSVTVSIDSLPSPAILAKSGNLNAIPANADRYQWLLDGKVLKDKITSTITMADAGAYQVQVTTGVCSKISGVYVVTGIGEGNFAEASAYPNPFVDKITVNVPEVLIDGNAVLYNVMGQPVQTTSYTSGGTSQAELKFPNLEPGAYILSVGGHKIKVVKVN